MNHKAIYKLYPNVVTIDDATGAFDANGNKVTVDESVVNAWQDPDQYKEARASAYKPITEQLDMMYWDRVNGTSTWKEHIDAVKAQHPKENA